MCVYVCQIHVMRDSLIKLREYSANQSVDPSADQSSRWLNHVSAVLKASNSCAEAILLGYPVLVVSDAMAISIT